MFFYSCYHWNTCITVGLFLNAVKYGIINASRFREIFDSFKRATMDRSLFKEPTIYKVLCRCRCIRRLIHIGSCFRSDSWMDALDGYCINRRFWLQLDLLQTVVHESDTQHWIFYFAPLIVIRHSSCELMTIQFYNSVIRKFHTKPSASGLAESLYAKSIRPERIYSGESLWIDSGRRPFSLLSSSSRRIDENFISHKIIASKARDKAALQ